VWEKLQEEVAGTLPQFDRVFVGPKSIHEALEGSCSQKIMELIGSVVEELLPLLQKSLPGLKELKETNRQQMFPRAIKSHQGTITAEGGDKGGLGPRSAHRPKSQAVNEYLTVHI